ncbi:glycosyl transferase family 2 [Nostocales cyanobacterium HT-58-2]|nr:glycosyl transferase family 2 [Nostocales cyanobacterium HT-58-2]
MNVVSRIQFPRTPETSSLYIQSNEGVFLNFQEENVEISFTRNGVLSFNTYFNSFYENFYAKYTDLHSLYYFLRLEGSFQVSLYREHHNHDSKELIDSKIFENCQSSQAIKIFLPESWRSENASRIYLEITCQSESGLLKEGFIATEQQKLREVALGIVSCTFKKEAYIKNTVNTILQDTLLKDKKIKVFIVDNGKTLKQEEFLDKRIQLIQNRNVGGSGGFTRGLIQAVQEDVYTHFLFMDDDIELDSESIYRLFGLYEYASHDFAISGSMLDLYKKHILYEAGAVCVKRIDRKGNVHYNPFAGLALKHNLDLSKAKNNNLLLSDDNLDYGAFWFFAFSKATLEKIDLPLPCFIRGDDVDFGLRIKERLNSKIVAFPGIAVWHEPFYTKHAAWSVYYDVRNRLIIHSMRGTLGYIEAIKFLTIDLLTKLLVFDYNSAGMVLKGFADYIKGPTVIKNNDPEVLHSNIIELSKSYKNQITSSLNEHENYHQSYNPIKVKDNKKQVFKKIIGLLTLNGHLLPNFLLRNEDALYWIGSDYHDKWYKVFARKRVVIYREGSTNISQYEMSRTSCIGILIDWLRLISKSSTKWSSIKSEWRNAADYFTSSNFWREYLHLNG